MPSDQDQLVVGLGGQLGGDGGHLVRVGPGGALEALQDHQAASAEQRGGHGRADVAHREPGRAQLVPLDVGVLLPHGRQQAPPGDVGEGLLGPHQQDDGGGSHVEGARASWCGGTASAGASGGHGLMLARVAVDADPPWSCAPPPSPPPGGAALPLPYR